MYVQVQPDCTQFVTAIDEILFFFSCSGLTELYDCMVQSLSGLARVGKKSRVYLRHSHCSKVEDAQQALVEYRKKSLVMI